MDKMIKINKNPVHPVRKIPSITAKSILDADFAE